LQGSHLKLEGQSKQHCSHEQHVDEPHSAQRCTGRCSHATHQRLCGASMPASCQERCAATCCRCCISACAQIRAPGCACRPSGFMGSLRHWAWCSGTSRWPAGEGAQVRPWGWGGAWRAAHSAAKGAVEQGAPVQRWRQLPTVAAVAVLVLVLVAVLVAVVVAVVVVVRVG
jgi:hypothetical protein